MANMEDNREVVEAHGCLICGRPHNMLVIYSPDGRFIDATVTSPGGHRHPDPTEPLAVCDRHTPAEAEAALVRRRARQARQASGKEDEDD
jgi:hypothetical protein